MIQQFHSWVCIWTKLYFNKTHVPLFIIAKTWKQPKCLSTDEWIRKILYIYILLLQSCLTVWTLWNMALQAPLSMGFSRKGYWSGLPCPPPGVLPDPGIEPVSYVYLLAGRFFTTSIYTHTRVSVL